MDDAKINAYKAKLEKKAASEADKESASKAYEQATKILKSSKEIASWTISNVKRAMADARKILIIAGKYALSLQGKKEDVKDDKKEAEDVKAENEAFDYALCEASDLYVYESLALD